MDIEQYIRFVAALFAVLAMIFVAMWLLKRIGMAGAAVGSGKSRRRLAVVEALALDTRRRLVLVRRDGVEHLLLLGASGDVVVETGLREGFAADLEAAGRKNAAQAGAPAAPSPVPVSAPVGAATAGNENTADKPV